MTKTILVIDDDDLIRKLVEQFLETNGYEILAASDGNRGLALFEEKQPALVVMDVAMPGMNGFEAARNMRAVEQRDNRSRTPIILLSAYARSFFETAGENADIDSLLTKPAPLDKLLGTIQDFLNTGSQSS